jgi:hypothetical protein
VAIKAWLIGDAVNLETLAHLLPEGDTRVVHDAERDAYYLTSPEIDNPPEGQAYYHVAKERDIVNTCGSVIFRRPPFRRFRLRSSVLLG